MPVTRDPTAVIIEPGGGAVTGTGQPGHLADWFLYGGREPAQLGHHLPGLGHADLGAWPRPPDARRRGYIPVDHLRGAHTPTVRWMVTCMETHRVTADAATLR